MSGSKALWGLLGLTDNMEETKQYMTRHSANVLWCNLWWENTPYTYAHPAWAGHRLSYHNYLHAITGYQSSLTQEQYQWRMVKNMRFWAELAIGWQGIPAFSEIPHILSRMEDSIIMPEVAKLFHSIVQSKAVSY